MYWGATAITMLSAIPTTTSFQTDRGHQGVQVEENIHLSEFEQDPSKMSFDDFFDYTPALPSGNLFGDQSGSELDTQGRERRPVPNGRKRKRSSSTSARDIVSFTDIDHIILRFCEYLVLLEFLRLFPPRLGLHFCRCRLRLE